MTKQEFERRMERARERIALRPSQGVCYHLERAFTSGVRVYGARGAFSRYFTPKNSALYWLDSRCKNNCNDNMNQLERRLVFLESFKGFCECYELYKEW